MPARFPTPQGRSPVNESLECQRSAGSKRRSPSWISRMSDRFKSSGSKPPAVYTESSSAAMRPGDRGAWSAGASGAESSYKSPPMMESSADSVNLGPTKPVSPIHSLFKRKDRAVAEDTEHNVIWHDNTLSHSSLTSSETFFDVDETEASLR